MKRRIELVTDVEREIVMTWCSVPVMFCEVCGVDVQMVTPEQAALQAGVTVRTIYRWVEAALVHFTETRDGRILICLNSRCQVPGRRQV